MQTLVDPFELNSPIVSISERVTLLDIGEIAWFVNEHDNERALDEMPNYTLCGHGARVWTSEE